MRSSSTLTRLAQQTSDKASDNAVTTPPILLNMGALLQKMFGPGANPLVTVDTTGACASECCDEVEVLSSGSSSSEPHTHASAHESFNTIPPDIENIPCVFGMSVAAPKACQRSGETPGIKL